MQVIWKFPLETADSQSVTMPRSAQVLCVQVQNGAPCLWALVHEIDSPKVTRTYRIYGTGHEHLVILGRYIGTYQLHDGALVFHVFEEPA